jgi:flavin reductase (DIM6/NTAB) family NADH-FMN oxidoreductase RutF
MKKLENNNIFIPMPNTVVGTKVDGKENFMAVGFVTRVNANPPMIGIGIGKPHYTSKGLLETKEFSLAFPKHNQLIQSDYVGIASGSNIDKSGVFDIFYGDLKNAPLLKGVSLNLECKIVRIVELPTNNFYIAEIVGAWSDDDYFTDGKLDFHKMEASILTMPDNKYWALGSKVGEAWSDGRSYQK